MLPQIDLLLAQYNLSPQNEQEFLKIIRPIIYHPEFLKRCNANVYAHHDNYSLGDHLLKDALTTYKLIKTNKKYQKANLKVALYIALFHDLYENPWQNSLHKKEHFINKHGFVHPLEAAINALSWYPKYFKDDKTAFLIIDGIIHHMHPFPVRCARKKIQTIEISNGLKFKKLNIKYQRMIIKSSNRFKIFGLSFSRSKSLEGRIVAKADKIVSFKKELRNFKSLKSCLTGRLKHIN